MNSFYSQILPLIVLTARLENYVDGATKSFGLLSTEYGCPITSNILWLKGEHSVHFSDNILTLPPDIHLLGPLKDSHIQWNGCFAAEEEFSWPSGNYCILRASTTCSAGMWIKTYYC